MLTEKGWGLGLVFGAGLMVSMGRGLGLVLGAGLRFSCHGVLCSDWFWYLQPSGWHQTEKPDVLIKDVGREVSLRCAARSQRLADKHPEYECSSAVSFRINGFFC